MEREKKTGSPVLAVAAAPLVMTTERDGAPAPPVSHKNTDRRHGSSAAAAAKSGWVPCGARKVPLCATLHPVRTFEEILDFRLIAKYDLGGCDGGGEGAGAGGCAWLACLRYSRGDTIFLTASFSQEQRFRREVIRGEPRAGAWGKGYIFHLHPQRPR